MIETNSSTGRTLVIAVLVGILLLLLHLASPVVTPLLFAFFLAALAMPGYRWLQARGLKRGLALLLLILTLLAGGIALIVLTLVAVGHLQAGLSAYQEQLTARLSELQTVLA